MGSEARRPPEWAVFLENLPAMTQAYLGREGGGESAAD